MREEIEKLLTGEAFFSTSTFLQFWNSMTDIDSAIAFADAATRILSIVDKRGAEKDKLVAKLFEKIKSMLPPDLGSDITRQALCSPVSP
jgi:hypothetical protein